MIKINIQIDTDEDRKTTVIFHGERVLGEDAQEISKEEAISYVADLMKSLAIHGVKVVA